MPETYVVLDVTAPTFREIQQKLEAVGYHHAFLEDADGHLLINLRGIAVRDEEGDDGVTLSPPWCRA